MQWLSRPLRLVYRCLQPIPSIQESPAGRLLPLGRFFALPTLKIRNLKVERASLTARGFSGFSGPTAGAQMASLTA